MNNQMISEIVDIIHKVTRIDKEKITDTISIRNDLYVDSLQAIQITSLLEDKFDIEIDEVEIFNVDNVQDLYQLVLEAKNLK